jgi:hypothetical protein
MSVSRRNFRNYTGTGPSIIVGPAWGRLMIQIEPAAPTWQPSIGVTSGPLTSVTAALPFRCRKIDTNFLTTSFHVLMLRDYLEIGTESVEYEAHPAVLIMADRRSPPSSSGSTLQESHI